MSDAFKAFLRRCNNNRNKLRNSHRSGTASSPARRGGGSRPPRAAAAAASADEKTEAQDWLLRGRDLTGPTEEDALLGCVEEKSLERQQVPARPPGRAALPDSPRPEQLGATGSLRDASEGLGVRPGPHASADDGVPSSTSAFGDVPTASAEAVAVAPAADSSRIGGGGGGLWARSKCTLENDTGRRRCLACNERRPVGLDLIPNGGINPDRCSDSATRKSKRPSSPARSAGRTSRRPRTAYARAASGTSAQSADHAAASLPASRVSASPHGPLRPAMAQSPLRSAFVTRSAAEKPSAPSLTSTPHLNGTPWPALLERYDLEGRLLRGRIRRAQQQVEERESQLERLRHRLEEAQAQLDGDRQSLDAAQQQWRDFQRDYDAVRSQSTEHGTRNTEPPAPHTSSPPLHCSPPPSAASVPSPIYRRSVASPDRPTTTFQQLQQVASKLKLAAAPENEAEAADGTATSPSARTSVGLVPPRASPIDSQATIDPDLDAVQAVGIALPMYPSRPSSRVAKVEVPSRAQAMKPPPLSVSTNRRATTAAAPAAPIPAPPATMAGWDSTKPSRDFVAPRRRPSAELRAAGAATSKNATATGNWIQAAKRARIEHRERQLPKSPSRDGLWDDYGGSGKSSALSPPQPQHPYHEVVRNRAKRDHLPRHDCYCCRDFYAALDPQDALALLPHSRHRAQFSPSETPQDFWVVDFVDELEREADREREESTATAATAADATSAEAASRTTACEGELERIAS